MPLIEGRDSVMKHNMKGETPDMYVITSSDISTQLADIKGTPTQIVRGLWEMNGDAMGGPFVLHAVTDSATHTTLMTEVIIYEPSGKKRNKISLTEASLYTIKKTNEYGRK